MEINNVVIYNRFILISAIAEKLKQMGCDLADYGSEAIQTHHRTDDIDPQSYAILSPRIDTRKNILGLKIGSKPISKVLCDVFTEYSTPVSMAISKISFHVYGQENLGLVTMIIREIYAPTFGENAFRSVLITLTVVKNADEYESIYHIC